VYVYVQTHTHMYIYIYIYLYIRSTPSKLNVRCLAARFQKNIALTNKYKYIQNVVWRIKCYTICSSAQDYAALVVLLISVGWVISVRPKWSDRNVLYKLGTSSQRSRWRGCLLNFNMMHRVRTTHLCLYDHICRFIYIQERPTRVPVLG